MKHGGKRRRLQICYSYVYRCAIGLVPGSKKVSAKAQVACYSKSKKKNRSPFYQRMNEDVNVGQRRKSVWVLARPQFWFENMVLNQCEDNFWGEHYQVSRETFWYIFYLVSHHLVRQDTNMHQSIPVQKRVGVALWHLATGNSHWTTGLVFGVGRCTALKLKEEFCSAPLRVNNDYIKFPKGEAETRCNWSI